MKRWNAKKKKKSAIHDELWTRVRNVGISWISEVLGKSGILQPWLAIGEIILTRYYTMIGQDNLQLSNFQIRCIQITAPDWFIEF